MHQSYKSQDMQHMMRQRSWISRQEMKLHNLLEYKISIIIQRQQLDEIHSLVIQFILDLMKRISQKILYLFFIQLYNCLFILKFKFTIFIIYILIKPVSQNWRLVEMESKQPNRIQQNYDEKAINNSDNVLKRQQRRTYQINSFNNWIKSVLMNVYSEEMCKKVQKQLDLKKGDKYNKILHVLDIGCGRGQDILKWKLCRVNYMVATDFSEECIKEYERRWTDLRQPYGLYTLAQDFTKKDLYYKIQHSYYDIVSAQFCFHYMFGTEAGLKNGLSSIFSNLLIDGVFIATIPDGYTILKKINQRGQKQPDGSTVYGNTYFSIRFKNTKFTKPFGNVYQFYLEDAVGQKDPDTGQIKYVQQWLISLDQLEKMLKVNGMQIQTTMNFLQFYMKYRQEYKQLFSKFKLNYEPNQSMDPQIWEIGHLYRVLICRKVGSGKHISDFDLGKRKKAARKQIQRQDNNRDRTRGKPYDNRNDRRNENYRSYDSHKSYDNKHYNKYDNKHSDSRNHHRN